MDTSYLRLVGMNLSRVAIIALAAFGAFALLDAQQRTSSPPPFTAGDRLEIHELLHRYMFVLDSCPDHNNGYEYADLYTEDGVFGRATRGREALARAAGRTSDGNCSEFRKRGAMNQVHVNVAPIIEPDARWQRARDLVPPDDGRPGPRDLLERLVSGCLRADSERLAVQVAQPRGRHACRRPGRPVGSPCSLGARAHAGRQPQPARESEAGSAAENCRGSAQVAGERPAERARITPDAVDSGRRSSCVSF